MGVVHAAHHPRWGDVALKVVPPHLLDASALDRLRREAEALARLDHPHLARVVEVGLDGATPFVAMRLVPGESLHARLRGGPLPVDQVARLGAALADGLAHAHARGVLHRDVKPGNVLLEQATGAAVLVDFGLARLALAQRLTVTGEVLGTPAYMAPEQAIGDPAAPVGAATDVYGLGATLYEALTGAPPFTGSSNLAILDKVLREAPVPPGRLRPGLDPALERLVLECLEKEPAARPTLDDVARRLERWSGGRPARRRRRRRATWRAGAVVLLVGVAGAAAAALMRRHAPAPPSPERVVEIASVTTAPAPPPPGAADAALRRALDAVAPIEAVLLRRAQELVDSSPATALHLVDTAAAVAPYLADTWFIRACAHLALGDSRMAAADLERADASPTAVSIARPFEVDAVHGFVLYERGRAAEARPYLERTAAHPDATPDLIYTLGLTLRALQDNAAAVEPLRRALALGVQSWQARFNLAAALHYSDRHQEALAEYARARAAPDYRHYLVELREGELLLYLDRPAEAVALMRPCLSSSFAREVAANPQFTAALALALVRSGEVEEGAMWAERSIAADPDVLRPYLARVEALLALGRREEAGAAFDLVRERWPDEREVRRLEGVFDGVR